MCGIVGYSGKREAVGVILRGLSKLEYRGYDSAGVAVSDGESLGVYKSKGRLGELEAVLEREGAPTSTPIRTPSAGSLSSTTG